MFLLLDRVGASCTILSSERIVSWCLLYSVAGYHYKSFGYCSRFESEEFGRIWDGIDPYLEWHSIPHVLIII